MSPNVEAKTQAEARPNRNAPSAVTRDHLGRKESKSSNSSGKSRCQQLLASMDTADIMAVTGGGSIPSIPGSPKVDSQLSVEVPRTLSGRIELEIQRVRQQISDMADQLKDAFANEKYEQVKVIGEKKKELEEKLKRFEEQYSNDKVFYEMESIKQDISSVDESMKEAFESESYAAVADLGVKKKELQTKLAELESNFGLHNSVFQVGDRVSVTGLTSPRGGVYNGLEGVITEYLPEEKRYKVVVNADGQEKTFALQGKNLEHREAAEDTGSVKSGKTATSKGTSKAASTTTAGKSQTRQLEGEIKLWFPRKHFGFITPDNKPDNEPDIFFHGTHVENREEMPIKRFARVKFSQIPAPKGPQARDVSITTYQPDKEREAEAAEAASKSPKDDKVTRPDQQTRKGRKKRQQKPKAGFSDEINIEDPLGPVSPKRLDLGLGGNFAPPSWATRTDNKPKQFGRKGGSLNARAKPFLSSIDEKRQSRAHMMQSHPPPPGWRQGSIGGHPNRQREPRGADGRNWGSLSSEMGNMRWDSIRSVSDFFAARASAGPVKGMDQGQKG